MLRFLLPTILVLTSCGSCASSKSSKSSASSASSAPVTRREVLDLKEAAEAAQHCAGEEGYDAARRAELEACITTSMKKARALLPRVVAQKAMQPKLLATIRLYVEDDLSAADRKALCKQVPTDDDVDSFLDDEARDVCGLPSP